MFRLVCIFFIITINLFSYEEIGSYYGEKETDIVKPIGVKTDEEGNIYIADFVGGKIVSYSKENKVRYVIKGLGQMSYVLPVGEKIYVSVGNKHKIIVFNKKNGQKLSEFGSFGMKQGEFKNPGGIYSYENNIYIIDEMNARIEVFDGENKFVREILLPKNYYFIKGAYSLNYIALFGKDYLYVLDKYTKKIYKYNKNINFQKRSSEEFDISFIDDPAAFFYQGTDFYIFEKTKNKLFVCNDKMKIKEEKLLELEKEIDVVFPLTYSYTEDIFHLLSKGDYYTYSLNDGKLTRKIDFDNVEEWEYIEPVEVRKSSKGDILILDKKLERILIFGENREYKRNIKNIGKLPTGFYLDDFDNIYIAAAGENKVKKLNYNGEIIYEFGAYGMFDTSLSYYYDNIPQEEKDKRPELKELMKADGGIIYNMKIVVDKNGYIYVADSKKMKIKVFDQFFKYQYEFGQKATIVEMLSGKRVAGTFGWDEQKADSLKSLETDGEMIYAVDNIYKRVTVYKKGLLVKTIEEKIAGDISSVGWHDNVTAITDTDGFRVVKYNKEDKKEGELSLLNDGIMPTFFDEDYMIGKINKINYRFLYKVYDLKGKKNDRNQKSKSNTKK